ncbi:MAG: serine/threonine protein kinase [Coriobacteriia bacterium]|nr:serine/threonine protein kinase [Coriobacteriia bacterium]
MAFDSAWIEHTFGKYHDFRELPGGGQKAVFRCLDANGAPTVLKLFHPGRADRERVLREVRAPDALGVDARVPRIIEAASVPSPTGDVIYIVEQQIAGKNLRECLAGGPLSGLQTMAMTRDILDVLVKAERIPVVHRDIKPENIIIDPEGQAWLLDFGIARFLDMGSLTATSSRFGLFTPGYAPVEQFNNVKSEIDTRADLFALGTTVFECITGMNPYTHGASSMDEILRRVENQQLDRLPASAAVPSLFVDLVEALTRTRANHRPPSARDALEWVNEALGEIGETD